MSIENIIFEKEDTIQETAKKTALIYAGSTELTKQLAKLKVSHTKIERGLKTIYILRGSFGRIELTL